MAKILLLDDLNPAGAALLEKAGHEVTQSPPLDGDALIDALKGMQAVAVRSATKIQQNVMEAVSDLEIIGRAGVGTDNIDKAAAAARGIKVINAPLANTNAAAEHTLAMMMALSRKIPLADRLMRQGEWPKKKCVGSEFPGKVLGVVGAGHVGRRVIDVARALGMTIKVSDPALDEATAKSLGIQLVDLDTLITTSDFITLHIPLIPATKHLINAKRLASMKQGARLINCARGGVVDEQALADSLKSGHLAGAAIDVFEEEPLGDSPLKDLDNCILTPHLGASTSEAQVTAATDIAKQFNEFFASGKLQHEVSA